MTEFIDLTGKNKPNKTELVSYLNSVGEANKALNYPHNFEKVILLHTGGVYNHDLILCIDDKGVEYRYLGHWNEGC